MLDFTSTITSKDLGVEISWNIFKNKLFHSKNEYLFIRNNTHFIRK